MVLASIVPSKLKEKKMVGNGLTRFDEILRAKSPSS
jgi:hypothetical protein